MSDKIFGIDLGTSNIKIYQKGKGVVIHEKNIIAIQGKKDIFSFGNEAYEMHEKAPESINVCFPMLNGVIAQFDHMQTLLRLFLSKKELKNHGMGHREYYIAVPTDITEVEKKAFYDLIAGANLKAKDIQIIEKPIADAVGAGLNVTEAQGIMMIDIGAATTEISVLSLGGIVLSKLLHVGGNRLDESICLYVKKKYNLIIGFKTANALKERLSSALPDLSDSMKVLGRDLITGLPLEVDIQASLVFEAIQEYLLSIIDAAKVILERTPPELSSDIINTGVYITGGCAQIANLAQLVQSELELDVNIVNNPEECVIRGIGQIIDDPVFHSLAHPIKQQTYH